MSFLQSDGPGEQPAGEVGGAERADLAGAHQPVERFELLLERHVDVGRVHLIQVDHIDAHALQRGVAGGADAIGRQPGAARRVGHREPQLGGHDNFVAVQVPSRGASTRSLVPSP